MKHKTILFITIANTIFLLFLSAFLFFKTTQNQDEVVFVDNIRLFNGFNMTKDLNKINGEKIKKQKKTLDSLYTIYGIFRDNGQTDKLETLEAQLRIEDQKLKGLNEQFSKDVGLAVWNRLNAYIKEYCVANDYKMVMGTQGNGNVMYAEDGRDITNAIIEYSNVKYEGEP